MDLGKEKQSREGGRDGARGCQEAAFFNLMCSIRSYNFLRMQSIALPHNFIWDVKLSLRLKIYLWLVMKRSILTKDNLGHRGWMGDKKCMFCGAKESIDHLFLQCHLARYIWNIMSCIFGLPSPPSRYCLFILFMGREFCYEGQEARVGWRFCHSVEHLEKGGRTGGAPHGR